LVRKKKYNSLNKWTTLRRLILGIFILLKVDETTLLVRPQSIKGKGEKAKIILTP
jgi:hypothetical protein